MKAVMIPTTEQKANGSRIEWRTPDLANSVGKGSRASRVVNAFDLARRSFGAMTPRRNFARLL